MDSNGNDEGGSAGSGTGVGKANDEEPGDAEEVEDDGAEREGADEAMDDVDSEPDVSVNAALPQARPPPWCSGML
jgi:hypothetical protein